MHRTNLKKTQKKQIKLFSEPSNTTIRKHKDCQITLVYGDNWNYLESNAMQS